MLTKNCILASAGVLMLYRMGHLMALSRVERTQIILELSLLVLSKNKQVLNQGGRCIVLFGYIAHQFQKL
jgi:hypothetical protein